MYYIDFPSTPQSSEIAEKYGYSEFVIRRWLNFFEDAIDLIEKIEEGIPKYIRVNTLKIEESELIERLKSRGFEVKETEVPFCYEVIEEPYSIGATPEYLMGYYYIMDKSSCIPPLALNPEPGDVIADFTSSPGGKTTFLAQLIKNKGVILAVESNYSRACALIDNIHRMGVMNTAVLRMDAKEFPKLGIKVDKILLDAPCSCEGVMHRDPLRKSSFSPKDIETCSDIQLKLLNSALKSLKSGGVLVYSTCSMSPEENEMVVQKILDSYPVRLEEIEWGENAFTEIPNTEIRISIEMRKARRFYPHKHRTSGFFVSKILLEYS
ncbi:MAG TPA: NOL1/NOP2/sun family putative RNA methylase [Archaeoglobaceae archaeon]|nr:NOL1/NOP2/sun family putative RNA methylase [Archaeoglobaceae archaeon]